MKMNTLAFPPRCRTKLLEEQVYVADVLWKSKTPGDSVQMQELQAFTRFPIK